MARLFFTLSVWLLILIVAFGFSNSAAAGQLEKASLAVEGMTCGA